MSYIYEAFSNIFSQDRDLCASDDCIITNTGGGSGASIQAPLVDIAIGKITQTTRKKALYPSFHLSHKTNI